MTDTAPDAKQTSETRRWDLLLPSTSEENVTLVTAEHKILNFDEESRNDHWKALILRIGYKVFLRNVKIHKKQHTVSRDSCFHFERQEGYSQTIQRSSSKRVRICIGHTTRMLIIFQMMR